MKYIIIVFILSLNIHATNAIAASPSHIKAANDLLDTMNINKLLAESIEVTMQLEIRNNPQLGPYPIL